MLGDLLVQQVRSAIGATSEQRECLQALGLAKIGRSNVVRSDKRSVRGQLHDVRHLIAVKPLTVSALRRLHLGDVGGAMRSIPYEVEGREARRFEVDADSYLAVELYEREFSLTWATELPIASILARVARMLPAVRADTLAVVYDLAAQRQIELHAEPLLHELRRVDHGYPFVSIDFVDLTIAWRCPEYPRHVDHDVLPGEFGIVSRWFDERYFSEFVRVTATPALGGHADEILKDVRYVGEHVRRGMPRELA